MNARSCCKWGRLAGLVFVPLAGLIGLGAAPAAEPIVVGILAVVDDPDVAKELGLSEDQKQKLTELLDAREADALELSYKLRDLTPGEKAEKLAPFRRESEEKGLALLTSEQRSKLDKIRIRRMGLASLAEPDVAKKLDLTEDQRAQVAGLLRAREDRLAVTGKDRVHIVRSDFEQKLAAILSQQQKTAWEGLITEAGGQSPEASAAAPSTPASEPAKPEDAAGPATAAATPKDTPATPKDTPATPKDTPATPKETAATPKDPSVPPNGTDVAKRPAAFPDDFNGKMEPGTEAKPAEKTDLAGTTPGAKPGEPAAATPGKETGEKKIRFSFRYQPWKDVLDWFAEQAKLSLLLENPPPGTFNYTDEKEYTPAQAIDLLNSVLLTKGYVLIRRNRMLMLINLDDGIPPNLVDTITAEDLEKRGDYELVSVAFQLQKLTPEEIEAEVRKMIGPQGTVVSLSKSKQLWVTETVGRLKAIRRTIERSEDPEGRRAAGKVQQFETKYADPVKALAIIRQFLDIAPEQSQSQDGSIKVVLDATGKKYLVSGKDEKLARFTEVLKVVDVPEAAPKTDALDQTPQLEVYGITSADPQSVLQVIQTLLAGSPDAKLALDPKTGNLVALCKPSEHATIKATLDQMQKDARKIEVIQLTHVDPQTAVSSIKKLFGIGETPDPNKPQVEADIVTKQLMVRASESQLAEIKLLLEKMGESGSGEAVVGTGGNVRMLPLTGRTAKTALERAQEIWPATHKNRIRVVTPSAAIPTLRPSSTPEEPAETEGPAGVPLDIMERLFGPGPFREMLPGGQDRPGSVPAEKPATRIIHPKPATAPAEPPAAKPVPAATPSLKQTTAPPAERSAPRERSAANPLPGHAAPVFFASQLGAPAAEKPSVPPETGESAIAPKAEPPAQTKPKAAPDGEPAPIIVAPGSGGIMIASEDLEALDAFEELLNSLAGSAFAGELEVTVFYLKHAKAEVVAETLEQIFGAGSSGGGGGGGGGGLLGNIAGAALGDAGGGILGSLLGLGGPGGGGGGISPSGTIQITPDPRLNALVVQANAKDVDTIEQLLKILDQKESPEEVAVQPKPRVIPVVNMAAEDIAELVRQGYQDRLVSGGGAAAQRQPTPQEFMQMLRGGGGRRGGGAAGRGSADAQQKMSIVVDSRNNALIVVAPDLLFQEIKELVEQLDHAAGESNQTMRVVALKKSNPAAVEQALAALVGDSVQFGRTSTTSRSRRPGTPGQQPGAQPQPPGQPGVPDAIQQQIQQFRSQFQGGGFNRQGGGTRGGGTRGGGTRGGGMRGG